MKFSCRNWKSYLLASMAVGEDKCEGSRIYFTELGVNMVEKGGEL